MAKQSELLEAPAQDALVVGQSVGSSDLTMFERLASDPNTSVEKIERLMALYERAEARRAESAFNAAMSEAQAEMRPIAADATNPQTHSRYATYAKLDGALRPIYTKFGFALSFNTGDSPLPDTVRLLCDVTHGGHAKSYKLDMPADGKGAKGGDVMTKTHATGAAMSYGMRYLLKMIFNVAVGEDDRDGNKPTEPTQEPKGYSAWIEGMEDKADEGTAALDAEWKKANPMFRAYVVLHAAAKWDALKKKAAKRGA